MLALTINEGGGVWFNHRGEEMYVRVTKRAHEGGVNTQLIIVARPCVSITRDKLRPEAKRLDHVRMDLTAAFRKVAGVGA